MNPIEILRQRIAGLSYREAGKLLGVSHAYIYDAIVGRRAPGQKLLKALGLERTVKITREVKYRKARKSNG